MSEKRMIKELRTTLKLILLATMPKNQREGVEVQAEFIDVAAKAAAACAAGHFDHEDCDIKEIVQGSLDGFEFALKDNLKTICKHENVEYPWAERTVNEQTRDEILEAMGLNT